jgi:curved DNA-binding protein
MEFKDYYQIMGVRRDATQDEIKRAYRKLARKYHPDVSKEANAEARFKEVGEAYEVLKDPEKRAAYDQLGANWKAGQEFRPPPDWDQGFEFHRGGVGGEEAFEFSDFFETLFGRGFAEGAPRGRAGFHARGGDAYARVLIDLEDAYHGATPASPLQGGRPGRVSRSARRSLGGGARREREGTDAHRGGGPQDPRRLGQWAQTAHERARYPRHARRGSVRGAQYRAAAGAERGGEGGL